jgi:HD superfamily phosphodiesterase
MVSLNQLFAFVLMMTKKYNIDYSHSEGHSMDVLRHAEENLKSQLVLFPYLENQTNVIYSAAILHDMCDKKYMKQEDGVQEIEQFLKKEIKMDLEEIHYTKRIMETMSYSTVKKQGFPDLGKYQTAYNVVREADLLTSYDFDRSIIYHLNRGNDLTNSYQNALEIFNNRVFNYNSDKLLLSEYAKKQSQILTLKALKQMTTWNRILQKTNFL